MKYSHLLTIDCSNMNNIEQVIYKYSLIEIIRLQSCVEF